MSYWLSHTHWGMAQWLLDSCPRGWLSSFGRVHSGCRWSKCAPSVGSRSASVILAPGWERRLSHKGRSWYATPDQTTLPTTHNGFWTAVHVGGCHRLVGSTLVAGGANVLPQLAVAQQV